MRKFLNICCLFCGIYWMTLAANVIWKFNPNLFNDTQYLCACILASCNFINQIKGE